MVVVVVVVVATGSQASRWLHEPVQPDGRRANDEEDHRQEKYLIMSRPHHHMKAPEQRL